MTPEQETALIEEIGAAILACERLHGVDVTSRDIAAAALAVAKAHLRDEVLEEVAMWHKAAEKRLEELIEADDTLVTMDRYSGRMAGHNVDAESIRAMKTKEHEG